MSHQVAEADGPVLGSYRTREEAQAAAHALQQDRRVRVYVVNNHQ